MATLFVNPFAPVVGLTGLLSAGAKAYFYDTGTLDAAPVYDADGDELAQPVQADITGRFPAIYFGDDRVYRVILKTALGVELGDVDPYNDTALATVVDNLAAADGSSLVGFQQLGTGAIARTARDKMRDVVDARDFGVTGTGDETAKLQSFLDACEGRIGQLPPPASGWYDISTQLNGRACKLRGMDQNTVLFRYNGATTIPGGGAMLSFADADAEHVHIDGIGFRWGNGSLVAGNQSSALRLTNPSYFEIENVTIGGNAVSTGSCRTKGIHVVQNAILVPPRSCGVIRNVLSVIERSTFGDGGGAGSAGIWLQGHVSQAMTRISLEGWGNLEHSRYAIYGENLKGLYVGPGWLLNANTSAEIYLKNAAGSIIEGPELIPFPATGTGIYLDTGCLDTTIIAPNWNFSSGAPLADIVDVGAPSSRTTILMRGANGALAAAGALFGPMQYRKGFDDVAPTADMVLSTTDTQSGHVIRAEGTSLTAPAWRGVDIGSVTNKDIERFEAGSVLLESMSFFGTRFMHAHSFASAASFGAEMSASQFGFYLNESGNQMVLVAKYADGTTVKSAVIALT